MVTSARLQYRKTGANTILYLDQYFSIVFDATDQYTFELSQLLTQMEAIRVKATKVRPIGLLEHHKPNILHFFTMPEGFNTKVKCILQALHRFPAGLASHRCMPHTMYIKMDNVKTEKRSLYLFAKI